MTKNAKEASSEARRATTTTVRRLAAQGATGFSRRLIADAADVGPVEPRSPDAAAPIRLALARIPTRRSASAAQRPATTSEPPAKPSRVPHPGSVPEQAGGQGAKGGAERTARRAAQAALGMLGREAIRSDDVGAHVGHAHVGNAHVGHAHVGHLSEPDLQRLAKLIQVAGTGSPPLLDKVEQHLADRGVHLEVKAGTVTINIGTGIPGAGTLGTGPTGTASTVSGNPGRTDRVGARGDQGSSGSHAAAGTGKRRSYTPYVSWARRLMHMRDFLNGH